MLKNTGTFLFISFLFLASCRKSSKIIAVVSDNYTVQEQKTLGQAIDIDYKENFDILAQADYPEAYEYLTTLLEMIIRTPSVKLRDSLDWNIQLVHNDDKYQIFVSPSGALYITTGLLQNLKAENQIVALMSNQIYYLESGAAFDLIKEKNDAIEVGKVVQGDYSEHIHNMANTLILSSYSAETVLEADNFQVNLLCPFKYNSTGMIDVFDQVVIQSSLDKTMPWTNERATNIVANSAECGTDDSLFIERYTTFLEATLP